MTMLFVRTVNQRRKRFIFKEDLNLIKLKKSMEICGFSAKDANFHYIRTFYAQVEIVQSFTDVSKQKRILRNCQIN